METPPPIFPPTAPPSVLLDRVRSAYGAGTKALDEPAKPFLRPPFLRLALGVLVTLYGAKANVVQKYRVALNNLRTLSPDDFKGLVIEFGYLLESLSHLSEQHSINPTSRSSPPPAGRNVFIIHGHDEMNSLRLQVLLRDHFGLNPVVMRKEPGMSRALLTKFEDVASFCSMAFALMTPDDQITNATDVYLQARPNVIFEAGWFVGRLGIHRVCLLLKEGTEVHSDIDGISRVVFRDNVEEKVIDIQRELAAVGLSV
jgi:predicted nucleotide-binding protein